MKKFSIYLVLLGLVVLTSIQKSFSQNVNVSGAIVGNGTYLDLASAFTAVNGGAQGGATIVIDLVNNTTEPAGGAILNAGTWTSVLIRPQGGNFTVTGAATAGLPLIDLNGADNVTVDGLNSGGNSLIISNTTASGTSGTSTIRFINGASTNTITNCTIQGSFSATVATNGGNIFFSTDGLALTGNDNNTISNNNLGPAGVNLPTKCIYGNGTTTAVANYNSGNIISGNNISDYFSATVASAGIFVAGGNTDYTIQNNKFFQTATRTQTTGTTHAGIQLNSANIGNTVISGNTIGFSNALGTGTYTLVGVAASKFAPISLNNVSTTLPASVQGNTITNIGFTGAMSGTSTGAPFIGIFVGNGLANVGNLSGNLIGSTTASSSINIATNAAATADIYGIYFFPTANANIQNNQIGGMTAANSGTGALVYYGIRAFTGSAVTNTIVNNTVGFQAAPIGTSSTTSATSQTVGIFSQTGTAVVTGNIVRAMGAVSAGTGTGSTSSVIGIRVDATGSTAPHNVTDNQIHSIGNNNAAANTTVSGLVFSGSTTQANVISRNFIHSLSNSSTLATATINGIAVIGGTNTFSNNMIRLGIDAAGADITNNYVINGINETAAGTDNFYHNSVFIGGAGVGAGAANTFAFNSSITTNTRNFQDNIFVNARSNGAGTGVHFAIRVGGTAPNPAGLTSNYNDLLASGTGGAIGQFNAITQLTLVDWQTATGQDLNSISSNPQFIAPLGNALTVDLHINTGIATAIESAGLNIPAITIDFDNQTRSGLTPVDMGADAGNFILLDIVAPTITYTALGFTCTTGDRVLTATISDATGVPTAGILQPRIYYRKNAGTYFSTQGTLSSGTGINGTWNFNIVASDMGGLVIGDVVSYFVIAQDIAGPFIASNPSIGLVATDVNTVTTPPTTPNSYSINATLSGTYTVGAAGFFPTLTAAVNAYNTSCIGGPVVFSLIDATYPGETFPITINANPFASAVNTLTIQPANPGTSITGSSATALIIGNGADYVTINGSTSSTLNTICPRVTASRDLTLANTNASATSAVVSFQTTVTGDGATNNTIKNTVVLGNTNATTVVGINISGPTIGSGTGANLNSNNTVENNSIQRAQYGIYSAGSSILIKNTGNKFDLNTINGSGANSISRNAITIAFEDAPSIQANTIGNMVSTLSADVIAIAVGSLNISNTLNTGVEVTNAVISYNRINKIVQSNTYSAAGIVVASTATGTTLVSNNFIDSVFCNGTSGDFGVGIFSGGGVGQFNAYNNTVRIDGVALTGANQPNMAIGINGTTPNVDIRNNILICSGSTGSNTNTGIGLGYASTTGNYLNLISNNNDIFVSGTSSVIGRTGGLAVGVVRITLIDWQTETGRDAASITTAPVFTGGDLHLLAGSNPLLNNSGATLPSITNDIDCETRNTPPDMGADEMPYAEINVQGNSISIVDGDVTASLTDHTDFGNQSICSGTVVRTYTIQNTGTATLNLTSITLSGTGAADYTVGGISLPTAVSAAGSTTFTVSFDPSSAGAIDASISIVSDDENENPYDYSIQGTGVDPEVNVQGNATNIPDGNATISLADHTDFGSACLNAATIQRIYTIENTGASTLNISSINTSGADAAMFVVSGAPATIAAASSATFTVTFTPSATGVKNATVNINSNDCDEALYNYDVQANVNALPTPNASNTGPYCSGTSIQLNSPTGSATDDWTGPLSYNQTNTQNPTITSSTVGMSGDYTVTVTDVNGCSATATTSVIVNASPNVNLGPDQSQCSGTVTLDAGNPGASYLWSTAESTQTIIVAATSTVNVLVIDVNGCTDRDTINIVINSSPSVALGSDITQCGGTVTLDAGNPGATFVWSPNGETTQTIIAAATGTYSVTATLPGGCTATDMIDVTINPVPTATANNGGPYCAGATIQLNSPSGSATDDWTGPLLYSQNNTQNPTIASATVGMSGVYTVTVTNGSGCTATATTTVVVNALPTPTANNTGPYCAGSTIQLNSPTGSATDDWTGPLSYNQPNTQNPTLASATVGMSGVYTVTVTNGSGCSATATTTVVVNALPTPTANNTGPYCVGATIQLNSPSGSATDDWTGPLSYNQTNTQNPTLAFATVGMSGVYTVTVTNGSGCTATATTTVVVNALPTPTANNTGPYCAGSTIQLNSPTGSATDDWTGPLSYNQPNTQNPTLASATVGMSGVYTVTVTNGSGCSATATTTVVVNALPTPTANNTGPYCVGATIQLNSPSGSATDDWTGPLSYNQANTQNPTIASATTGMAGVYTVTVTNVNGCSATATTTVVVNTLPVVNVSGTSPICAGNTSLLNGTSGGTSQWYLNGVLIPGATSNTYSATLPGVYNMIKTNLTGCFDSAAVGFTLVVNPLPTATANNTGPYCAGATIQLNSPSGSATDDWTGPLSYNQTNTQNPTIVSSTAAMSGVYTVTVTDGNGCSATATTTVVVNALPTPTANNTGPYCEGATIQLNSPSGSATDDWTGPLTYSQADTQNPTIVSSTVAMSGDYTVTVTDGNGCSATATTTVVVNAFPTPSATNTGPYCEGATIQLNSPSGSATDDWTGPLTYSSTDTQNPTIASSTIAMSGDYTVTVTNGAGCSATATTTVVVNAQPSVNLGADVVQPNPPAVLDAGAGFTSYLWSTTETTQIISVTTNGQYIVTVTTAGVGCSDSDTINVNFTSGVVNVDGSVTNISLYPNPSNGPFNVSIDNIETSNLVIDIMDMTGRIVYNRYVGSVSGNTIESFDMTNLRMGTYVLRVMANGKSTQMRFMISQ